MDKLERTTLRIAGILLVLAVLFPPFRLGNGQPQWAFIGTPPLVSSWVTWDEIIANNFRSAGIHWGFLVMELFVIAVLAVSIWVSMNDSTHHHGHK